VKSDFRLFLWIAALTVDGVSGSGNACTISARPYLEPKQGDEKHEDNPLD
jgi:hypothetical protein